MAKNNPLLFKQLFIIISCSIFIYLTVQYSVGTSKPISYFNPSCNHSKTFSPSLQPGPLQSKKFAFKGTVHRDGSGRNQAHFIRRQKKRQARRFFGKICPPPIPLCEPLKELERLLVFLIANQAKNLYVCGENLLRTWINSTTPQMTSVKWSLFRHWQLKKKKLRRLLAPLRN